MPCSGALCSQNCSDVILAYVLFKMSQISLLCGLGLEGKGSLFSSLHKHYVEALLTDRDPIKLGHPIMQGHKDICSPWQLFRLELKRRQLLDRQTGVYKTVLMTGGSGGKPSACSQLSREIRAMANFSNWDKGGHSSSTARMRSSSRCKFAMPTFGGPQ